jgi:hypothetical protein
VLRDQIPERCQNHAARIKPPGIAASSAPDVLLTGLSIELFSRIYNLRESPGAGKDNPSSRFGSLKVHGQ